MYIFWWAVFGILTGIAMQSLFGEKKGIWGEITSGVIGAIFGGLTAMYLVAERNASFTIFSYILAFIGAFVFLFIFNLREESKR